MLPSAIRVRLNQQTHSIPFDQTEPLSLLDLTRHIKFAFKDIPLSSYDIVMDDQYTIHDNHTLQHALQKTTSTNTSPDITLLPKLNHTKNSMVPIIKPTVLRWTDTQDNLQNRRYSSSQTLGKRTSTEHHHHHQQQQQQQCQSITSSQADGSSTRKDSGISMDEPTTAKKQRVMSADQLAISPLASRKLGFLSSPPQHSMHNNIRALSPSPSHSTYSSIHPLEMRRPSTAPSSPSYSRRASNLSPATIKLPALLSITSSSTPLEINSLDHLPKLAPLQEPTQRQKCNLPGINASHPSPSSTTMLRTCSTGSHILSTSSPRRSEQHERHSIQYYQHRQQPSQQKQPGQFLCEQVVNPFSGSICGQTFRRSYDLSRHQTIHLKNRPFCYCDQCGKKFTRMDALRRHERVQGHSSKQCLLQTPSLQSPGSPSSPSPPHQRNQQYPNPTTTSPPPPPPSSAHALSFNHIPTTTQQARV